MKNTRPQISESVEKTVMELKQKFNALNIAGILSGPLSDAITQNVTGKIQDNIGNFIGKSPKSKMVSDQSRKVGNVDTNFYVTALGKQPVKKGDGVATVAGKLFNLYKKSFDEKKLQMELSRNFEQEIRREDERRHKDLINSIEKTSKTSKRNAPNKKVNVSKEDIKKVQENKGGIVSKVIGAVKDAGTAVVTATVVGGAVVAGAGLAGAIMSHESKGKSDSYNYGKTSRGRGTGGGYIPGVMGKDILGGKKLSEMTVAEVQQLQNNGTIYAAGKWQMIPDTMNDMVKKLKIDPTKQKFDDAFQDNLFSDYFAKTKRPIIGKYLRGEKGVSREDAVMAIAMEWSSVGVPRDVKAGEFGKDRNTGALIPSVDRKKGQSFYPGDSQGTSADLIAAELDKSIGKTDVASKNPTAIKVSETSNVQSARNLSIAGDSIAYGVSGTSLGKEAKTEATEGLTTRQIINAVKTKTTADLGKNGLKSKNEGDITNSEISVISAGTNDWGNLTNLSNDLEELRKVVNAKKYIWILPPNTTPDGKNIAGARKIVEAVAAKHNDETISFEPGADQIHPKPGVLEQQVRQKIKQLQSQTVIQKTETPNSGERLNNKTAENEKLKENIKPVSVINNSKKTTETGNKPETRILSSGDKPDYPIFMVS